MSHCKWEILAWPRYVNRVVEVAFRLNAATVGPPSGSGRRYAGFTRGATDPHHYLQSQTRRGRRMTRGPGRVREFLSASFKTGRVIPRVRGCVTNRETNKMDSPWSFVIAWWWGWPACFVTRV